MKHYTGYPRLSRSNARRWLLFSKTPVSLPNARIYGILIVVFILF